LYILSITYLNFFLVVTRNLVIRLIF